MTKKDEKVRADYVEHGSEEHMGLLNLRKATKEEIEDPETITYKGFTLVDITRYGTSATPLYLTHTLKQCVSELQTKPKKPQSEDPSKEGYAPPIWRPLEDLPEGAEPIRL